MWHRAQVAGDGEAGCRLLTETQLAVVVRSGRLVAIGGTHSLDSCVDIALSSGHWRIDRRTACRWGIPTGDLLDPIFGEIAERKQAAKGACST